MGQRTKTVVWLVGGAAATALVALGYFIGSSRSGDRNTADGTVARTADPVIATNAQRLRSAISDAKDSWAGLQRALKEVCAVPPVSVVLLSIFLTCTAIVSGIEIRDLGEAWGHGNWGHHSFYGLLGLIGWSFAFAVVGGPHMVKLGLHGFGALRWILFRHRLVGAAVAAVVALAPM